MRTAAELQSERIRREAKELVSKGDVSAKEARQEADRRIQEVEVRGRGCQGLLPVATKALGPGNIQTA